MTDISQVISDYFMIYLHMSLNVVFRFIFSVVGLFTNFINMVIFSKLGLKDSKSIGLFSLSLTDFLVVGIQLASSVSFAIDLLYLDIGTVAWYLGYYKLGWAISCVYEISCWITAMITIERCYCVVSPFTVKQVFTRFRCIVGTLTIYVVHIGVHIPIYACEKANYLETTLISENNTTTRISEYVVVKSFDPEILVVSFIIDITAGVSLWMFSQAVIIVCSVWMCYSLETSSKVRYGARYESENKAESQHAVYPKRSSTLSNRERRMVKIVLFLAITLTCCNVPKMITTVLYYTFPGVSKGNQDNLSTLLWALNYTFATLVCSVSFLVYLKMNTSYRREFNKLLRSHASHTNMTINSTSAMLPQ